VNAPRLPSDQPPARMSPLARLPVFFALKDKRVVVAGGTAAAAWKVELLSASGAHVDVYAEEFSEELLALANEAPQGPIVVHHRGWREADLAEATLAVGACDDAEAALFAAAARRHGVPVNVIDKPAFCDFSFGAIVNRSPLVVGISTDGAAPVFGQAIRARLEALIPRGFGLWAEAARNWRQAVQASGLSFNSRRRFWQIFTAHAVGKPEQPPDTVHFDAFMHQAKEEAERADKGSVVLVGAGPGDAELLTLRAVRALQSADVILFDDLVSPDVLDFARREARKMLVGKTGHGPACKQSEINALMISFAKAGRRVVRLKGGDPMIFGRAGEEIAACREAGIAVEVVPGISAAQGAAARLGVSLTHRELSRRLQYVTGHGADGRLPADIDWRALADPAATSVIYMPIKTLRELAGKAIAAGLDPATPALAVVNATRADETVLAGTIGDLPNRLAAEAPRGPVCVMVGRVFAERITAAASSGRIVAER
jgi:uroporphyrin-III C-methyltransferase/precorrin-2 dehydrogenase/sirohydrochlorin ferrochelatase